MTLVGTVKTRLAIEVARQPTATRRNGVWFVDLASLTDLELVPTTVLVALRLHEIAQQSLLERLQQHLRTRRLLLVLDNCARGAEALWGAADNAILPVHRATHERVCSDLLRALSERAFASTRAEGRQMSLQKVSVCALSVQQVSADDNADALIALAREHEAAGALG